MAASIYDACHYYRFLRNTIIRDQLTDPKFYAEMSTLLEDLIQQKRDDTKSYQKFLENAEALVRKLARTEASPGTPAALRGNPEATLRFRSGARR